MYLCYIDESGTSDIPGNTSHFVLAGLAIPVGQWKTCDRDISGLKARYSLEDAEIHTAWLLRKYIEQARVPDFASLSHSTRRYEVDKLRKTELYRLQKAGNSKPLRQTKKNYSKTADYIHLTHEERVAFVDDIARCVAGWSFARLFAECIDKIHFDPRRALRSVDEQAFEQVVSRFEQYLENTRRGSARTNFGILIHDNNETVSTRHTALMKGFHQKGTLWTNVHNIVETPMFVDSQLTSMVQIADLCGYALRRYIENGEEELFGLVFGRADRIGQTVVGVRHFSPPNCCCRICCAHAS